MRGKLMFLAASILVVASSVAPNGAIAARPSPLLEELQVPEAMLAGLRYHMVGPSRGGRVTAVAGHPARPGVFYMGASGGGVWKTTDYGQDWFPVSDGYFATGSIGAIAIADSNPDVVYVSTGSDGLRSNVIVGKGVYKSTDAGATWTHLGLEDTGNTGAVLVHPDNPDIVYVAAIGNPFAPNRQRGVYRSRNGGATWVQVLFVSDRTGAVDLEFVPGQPGTIYASMWETERKPWTILSGGMEGGVFKSEDNGDSWRRLTDGLPTGLRGKSDLAVSAAAPERVYVLIEAPGSDGGVYRSDDRGETWSQVTDFQPIRNRPFYYCNLHADPNNADRLWGMAEGFYQSDDAGMTWQARRVPHGDNHDLWVNPANSDVWIQSNDGGANITRDGGSTWSTQSNQPTAELYQVDVSDEFPYRLFAGQQDNSTISVPSLPLTNRASGQQAYWQEHGGCETGPAVPKPGDPDIVYANCKGRFGVFNRRTGQEQHYYVGYWNLYGRNPKDLPYRFQRTVPVHVSPHDPDRVYHASQFLHVTEDGGVTWTTISPDLTAFDPETQVVSGSPITLDVTGEEHFSVLYEVQESPHEFGVIWAGANDGPIHLTRDGGASWQNVTPPELGRYGRVQTIEVSPHHPGRAYAAVLRYQLGDFAPYVFRTEDYGVTWTRITTGGNGIPGDHPVRVVREDPVREGLLYAGTEFGMFVSFDNGGRWQSLQRNLPAVPVTDIKVVDDDLVLSTMGRSFWIMYDVSPLRQLSDVVVESSSHLFDVGEAVRFRANSSSSFGRSRSADPQYPRVGANIDYWLASQPQGELMLEISDARGRVIRQLSSAAPGERVVIPEPGMRDWPLVRAGTPRLDKGAGSHRYVWDLRYPGPWYASDSSRRSGQGGPMVPPGRYTARLSHGEWSSSTEFDVVMDPRVAAEGISVADVRAQAELSLRVRDTYGAANRAVAQISQIRDSGAAFPEQLQEVWDALVDASRRYSPVMLVSQLQYLYDNLNRADQRPSGDAVARHEELKTELDGHLEQLQRLLATR
ncbi:MAG TPA: hypothetical protein QGG47_16600 [Acidobacteriota bacterium]|nr:hypothetical protein [Acidobacteriota bacterium]